MDVFVDGFLAMFFDLQLAENNLLPTKFLDCGHLVWRIGRHDRDLNRHQSNLFHNHFFLKLRHDALVLLVNLPAMQNVQDLLLSLP
ncbi:hypothetical protein D3C79_1064200 [compost metagenome]